jgi:L-gulonate 5-dehydrogenase
MKAIIVKSPFNVSVEEVPKPELTRDDEVIVRVVSAGICGSDIGIYNGTNSLASYPRLIGHEYGGVVEAAGAKVSNVAVGDLVAVDPVRSCGACYACSIGRHNVCGTLEVTGVHRDGGFAEFVAAPAANVYKLGAAFAPRDLISMVEPYSIGAQVNARSRTGRGDFMVVMGSGPIGLCIMQVAKSKGARVLMTDLIDSRLSRALDMGADRVVNVKSGDLDAAVKEFSPSVGITVVADTVCSTESLELAMGMACPAGRVVCLGLSNKFSPITQVNITKKELDVVGSRLNNYRFPEVIEGFESGALTPAKLVTHRFGFERAAEAIDLIRNKPEEVCKVLLTF